MKFFKPEDFDDDAGGYGPYCERLAALANAKLEREGKVVYSYEPQIGDNFPLWCGQPGLGDCFKGLLVNIERIEEVECKKCLKMKERQNGGIEHE